MQGIFILGVFVFLVCLVIFGMPGQFWTLYIRNLCQDPFVNLMKAKNSFFVKNFNQLFIFIYFWWDWSLSSELGICKAGALWLEPHLQSTLLWLFWRWRSHELFAEANSPLIPASQVARITDVSRISSQHNFVWHGIHSLPIIPVHQQWHTCAHTHTRSWWAVVCFRFLLLVSCPQQRKGRGGPLECCLTVRMQSLPQPHSISTNALRKKKAQVVFLHPQHQKIAISAWKSTLLSWTRGSCL
jgi:hypothetical protein